MTTTAPETLPGLISPAQFAADRETLRRGFAAGEQLRLDLVASRQREERLREQRDAAVSLVGLIAGEGGPALVRELFELRGKLHATQAGLVGASDQARQWAARYAALEETREDLERREREVAKREAAAAGREAAALAAAQLARTSGLVEGLARGTGAIDPAEADEELADLMRRAGITPVGGSLELYATELLDALSAVRDLEAGTLDGYVEDEELDATAGASREEERADLLERRLETAREELVALCAASTRP